MRKKLLTLVVGALVVGLVGTAWAATKTVKVGGTLHAAISNTAGLTATITGYSKDKSLGQIAAVFSDAGIGKGKTSKVTLYAPTGTFSGTAKFDSVVATSGASDITISNGVLPIKKGTGAYKGVKGTIKFTGSRNKANMTFALKYSGSLKVKK